MNTLLLALSAAGVGFIHSLSPHHWIPLVFISKSRKWKWQKALVGAFVAAAGHIIVSVTLGSVILYFGAHTMLEYESIVEHYSGIALIVFGLIYAAFSYRRHHGCHHHKEGHTHHGPSTKGVKKPFVFLFVLGFSPCFAVLPIFIASMPHGISSLIAVMAAFAVGVILALGGAGVLVSTGNMKLDHPLLEHYADVIAGCAIAIVGVVLFFISS